MSLKGDQSLLAFKKFISDISHINVIQHLEKSEHMYAVRQFKVSQLSTGQALEIYQNIHFKFNRSMIPKFQLNWWENELRIFVWALILYVEVNDTKIEELTEKDWEFFSSIFPHKKEILFEYQSINILKEHGQAKKWVQEEDEIFSKLFNDKGLKCKWSELAKLLYIESQRKYFRTPKQCRQRWLNHLDPAKSKSEWSIREDYILICYVYEKEKKWAEISKLLENKRNEHSIKNRFKSLITKEKKFHNDKLEEADLVKCVYKRYTSHFGKLTNIHFNEASGFNSPTKKEGQKYISQQNLQENQQHFFRVSPTMKIEPQILMFPFTWHPKNKGQQNFVSLKKSKDFLTCNNLGNPNEKELNESMIGTNYASIQNFPGFFTPQSCEFSLVQKIKSEKALQKRISHFEEQNKNQKNQKRAKNKFGDMWDQNFLNDEDLSKSNNYERFLPQMMDEYDEYSSLERNMSWENGYQDGNIMEPQKQNDIDEEEKKIRAEIFLTEEPFELLREFFYQKGKKQKA